MKLILAASLATALVSLAILAAGCSGAYGQELRSSLPEKPQPKIDAVHKPIAPWLHVASFAAAQADVAMTMSAIQTGAEHEGDPLARPFTNLPPPAYEATATECGDKSGPSRNRYHLLSGMVAILIGVTLSFYSFWQPHRPSDVCRNVYWYIFTVSLSAPFLFFGLYLFLDALQTK